MQAKNMHRFRSLVLFFIALANIAISIPLAKAYEGIGSAIGTSLALICGNIIIMNIYYQKKVGINVIKFWKEIVKMTIPFCIPIIIIMIIKHFVLLHGFVYLVVLGGIYSIMYVLVCYLFVINKYEKSIIDSVLKKVHIKR